MKTEREEFEEWFENTPLRLSNEGEAAYSKEAVEVAYNAGRAPLLKRIEELKKRIEELEKEALLTDSAIQFLIDEVKPQHKETNKASDAQCPVCGYYCLGNGGNGCIDKPSICLGGTEK